MPRYTWFQIVKQGFNQLLITAEALGVLNQVIELRRKNPVGLYFKCCSIVYKALQNAVWYNIASNYTLKTSTRAIAQIKLNSCVVSRSKQVFRDRSLFEGDFLIRGLVNN